MISADNVKLTECINRRQLGICTYIMHAIYIIQPQAPGPALHVHLQWMAQIATVCMYMSIYNIIIISNIMLYIYRHDRLLNIQDSANLN